MLKLMLVALVLWGSSFALGACASDPAPAQPTTRTSNTAEPASCDEALMYEIADAHPEIRWRSPRPGASGNAALGCLLTTDADSATLETAAFMSSGLYRFVRECRLGEQKTSRVFEYKNKDRPYLLRLHKDPLVDPKTYIVVASIRIPTGTYRHSIAESSNSAAGIKTCLIANPSPE